MSVHMQAGYVAAPVKHRGTKHKAPPPGKVKRCYLFETSCQSGGEYTSSKYISIFTCSRLSTSTFSSSENKQTRKPTSD